MIGLMMLSMATIEVPSFIGANELKSLCERDRVGCTYYVAGASDALSFIASMGIGKPIACPSADQSLDQRTGAVINYLRINPDAAGSGFGIVATALSERYPCK